MNDVPDALAAAGTCAPTARWRLDAGPVALRRSPGPVAYPEALAAMEARVTAIAAGEPDLLWLLEHPPLYTAGTSAQASDLLAPERFPVFKAGRGGQYTYHGPGQRIGYVMMDLKRRALPPSPDIRCFVHDLEEWLIRTIARFGIVGERREGRIGIWVTDKLGREAKVAALGIRVRRWISFHGVALNVNPDLSHFTGIVPCGVSQHGVTSLQALGVTATMAEVDEVLEAEFRKVFEDRQGNCNAVLGG
ncbi:MAG: lipoyl(octanoyl) transferase LipB [Rhodospirillaceae bacterium]|nr:lipoyl(octanoyl) transferase LipB [Rhodospirillaceae bacterium]